MKYLDTVERRELPGTGGDIPEFFFPLLRHWQSSAALSQDDFPAYACFDVLDMPPALISHLILCKLIGTPRRFFYEVVGQAIERHNGFPAAKRYLADLPLKNKRVMAREFGLTVLRRCPIYSRGPYIGEYDYVKEIERLICPYRIEAETFAFVALARFTLDPVAMSRKKFLHGRDTGLGLHRST
ncbi:hypothetical protein NUH88_05475 [Nisaea acidiphila]|uniref:Uncharacterized protein n=1 Tax=Nisaea acidiphila TaxID=1862145 RepID=A0A9J7ATV3_9PROT|nr:hypothetical protein [Nisaea acidiphila]UUX51139.1 hypothetical protein NUH88_05475 [Nisaea acidiphila]